MRKKQLDGMRFVAILIIFLSHLNTLSLVVGDSIYYHFMKNADPGVDYFFLLSGFGIYMSFADRELPCGLWGGIRFAIDRVRRIYPLYVLTLLPYLLFLILTKLGRSMDIHTFFSEIVVEFIVCLCLLQSGTGIGRFAGAFNSPCWFLSAVFLCYIVMPFVTRKIKWLSVRQLCILIPTMLAVIEGMYLFLSFIQERFIWHGEQVFTLLTYVSPYIRVWQLLLGAMIAALSVELLDLAIQYRKVVAYGEMLGVICFFITYFFGMNIHLRPDLARVIDVFFVGCFLFLNSFGCGVVFRLLSSRSFYKLGRLSIYIYLMHVPLMNAVTQTLSRLFSDTGSFTYGLCDVGLNILCLSIAVLIVRKGESFFARYRV